MPVDFQSLGSQLDEIRLSSTDERPRRFEYIVSIQLLVLVPIKSGVASKESL